MSGPGALPPAATTALSRREALARIAWLMGGTLVGAEALLGCGRPAAGGAGAAGGGFSAGALALMDEIGEAILPTTDTPGAKAAGIGAFMAMVVEECYEPADQRRFRDGLGEVDRACRARFGREFLAVDGAERAALVAELDAAERARLAAGEPRTFFTLMKQLTLLGYFTSEIGCTQALRFQETPGSFTGCAALGPDEPAHFKSVGRGFRVGT